MNTTNATTMNIRFFILSGLLLISVIASTQTSLTVKGQYGSAWQNQPATFNTQNDLNQVAHFGFGVELFRQLNSHWALGVAPAYARRGTSFEFGFINGLIIGPLPSFEARLKLNYLQLPFLLRYHGKLKGELAYFIQGGAGFSYLMGGYREVRIFDSPNPLERQDLDFDTTDAELNRFDFGWQNSLGVSYPLGKGRVTLSGEYYNGFLDVDQKNFSQNRSWGIGLGYQMTISKEKE